MATEDSTVTFKSIEGSPGYRVGDDGSVWSCRVSGPKPRLGDKWRRLKPWPSGVGGQVAVTLMPGYHVRYVHRIVLEAFVGPPSSGMEGCHYDGNPLNNRLDNLRWDTKKANCADAIRHGRTTRGERNSQAKVTEEQVRAMRTEHATGTIGCRRLGQKYGLNDETVRSIIKRISWTHVI